jgi:hypothetical protein
MLPVLEAKILGLEVDWLALFVIASREVMSPMREHRNGTDRGRSFDDAPARRGASDETAPATRPRHWCAHERS